MGIFMFKLYKDKINISKDISDLNSQINVLKDNEYQKNNDLAKHTLSYYKPQW